MVDRISTNAAWTTAPGRFPSVATRRASSKLRRQCAAVLVLVLALAVAPAGALAAPEALGADWDSTGPKWIEINLSEQWLTAYEGDTPVFGAPVSTGMEGYETPEGDFSIRYMFEWSYMVGEDYFYPDVPYVMYIADYVAIHAVYWHESFGYPASHGCVNLSVPDAAWLFDWAEVGTGIWIHY
jgi:lipoprotein-anchoring transpeptidase ErfK/SrfK